MRLRTTNSYNRKNNTVLVTYHFDDGTKHSFRRPFTPNPHTAGRSVNRLMKMEPGEQTVLFYTENDKSLPYRKWMTHGVHQLLNKARKRGWVGTGRVGNGIGVLVTCNGYEDPKIQAANKVLKRIESECTS